MATDYSTQVSFIRVNLKTRRAPFMFRYSADGPPLSSLEAHYALSKPVGSLLDTLHTMQ